MLPMSITGGSFTSPKGDRLVAARISVGWRHMKRLTIASTLALGLALLGAPNSDAGTLTPATGGTSISAGTVGGAWTSLTGTVYTESTGGEVGTGTIILNVPAGFIFDTSCCPLPTMMINGDPSSSKNINNSANGGVTPLTVTSTQLTF